MTSIRGLDLAGIWTRDEAKAIIDRTRNNAAMSGLRVVLLEVTTMDDSEPKFILQARCARHDWPVDPDSACERCLAEFMVRT